MLFIQAGVEFRHGSNEWRRRVKRLSSLALFLVLGTGLVVIASGVVYSIVAQSESVAARKAAKKERLMTRLRSLAESLDSSGDMNGQLKDRLRQLQRADPPEFHGWEYDELLLMIDDAYPPATDATSD